MADGLANWMRQKGFETIPDFQGKSLRNVQEWKHLNLNYKIVARIDVEKCIGCDLCYTACWDGAHQCIHLDRATANGNGHHHLTPAEVERISRAQITASPVTKAAQLALAPHKTPLHRIPRVDED